MDKKRIWVIIFILFFFVIFWVFWYLIYFVVYDYGVVFVNMNVGGFDVFFVWFDLLNLFVCIVLGLVFGVLWFKFVSRL